MDAIQPSAAAGVLLELQLKCCCCGRVLDTHLTAWRLEDVMERSVWTRIPCEQCFRENPDLRRAGEVGHS